MPITFTPGESRQVSFTLDESNLHYWSAAERDWAIDPGLFDLWIGNSSQADLHTTFTVGVLSRTAR